MKRFLFTLSVLVILSLSVSNVFAADEASAVETEPDYVQSVLENENASDTEYLHAILICLKDIDMYVQFFVTLVFAVGLTYFVILKPIRCFLY